MSSPDFISGVGSGLWFDLLKVESVKMQEILSFTAENETKIVRTERVFQTARDFRRFILCTRMPSDRTASQNMSERTVLTDFHTANVAKS